jgi:hypothetical protein
VLHENWHTYCFYYFNVTIVCILVKFQIIYRRQSLHNNHENPVIPELGLEKMQKSTGIQIKSSNLIQQKHGLFAIKSEQGWQSEHAYGYWQKDSGGIDFECVAVYGS